MSRSLFLFSGHLTSCGDTLSTRLRNVRNLSIGAVVSLSGAATSALALLSIRGGSLGMTRQLLHAASGGAHHLLQRWRELLEDGEDRNPPSDGKVWVVATRKDLV